MTAEKQFLDREVPGPPAHFRRLRSPRLSTSVIWLFAFPWSICANSHSGVPAGHPFGQNSPQPHFEFALKDLLWDGSELIWLTGFASALSSYVRFVQPSPS